MSVWVRVVGRSGYYLETRQLEREQKYSSALQRCASPVKCLKVALLASLALRVDFNWSCWPLFVYFVALLFSRFPILCGQCFNGAQLGSWHCQSKHMDLDPVDRLRNLFLNFKLILSFVELMSKWWSWGCTCAHAVQSQCGTYDVAMPVLTPNMSIVSKYDVVVTPLVSFPQVLDYWRSIK